MTEFPKYLNTLDAINHRSADAIISHARIESPALNQALRRRFSDDAHGEGFLADPIFEEQKVWKPGALDMREVANEGILRPELVQALDRADPNRVPIDRGPYEHQLSAWRKASSGSRSYMVTSGTGSGKTECFMLPMINDLLNLSQNGTALKGVHAITLYPLNALIESQRERLSAWVAPFKDRLSYALYNGDMREEANPRNRPLPGQIDNRKDLRRKVPPILVTNVTMLEYLLLRPQDRTILEASKGKLRWIVLDEAHSYVGAQAAEMALMLRRVREAFGVRPEDVRLVATSATIGEGEDTRSQLRRYLADLAGVSEDLVDVIEGTVIKPSLPKPRACGPLDLKALAEMDEGAAYDRLAPDKSVRKLVNGVRGGGKSLSQITKLCGEDQTDPKAREQVFNLLAVTARAKDSATGLRLLPWRMHAFHRAQGGLWVCCNQNCTVKDPELAEEGSGWSWGQVHLFQRDQCDCGSAVFELTRCPDCGMPHLVAEEVEGATRRLRQPKKTEVDDYAPDQEEQEGDQQDLETPGDTVLISPLYLDGRASWMDPKTAIVSDSSLPPEGAIKVKIEAYAPSPCCGAPKGPSRVRYGAPFLLGNAMPLLLDGLPMPKDGAGKPFGGRRALSFTDSRQGTARLAAKLQQEAERALIRATVWHAVQQAGEGGGPEAIAAQEEVVAALEAIGNPQLADVLEMERAKLDELKGGLGRVGWSKMVSLLAENPQIAHLQAAWRNRDEGGHILAEDEVRMAEMLLLREFFRRPKWQNNAETMGLARLAWPKLENRLKVAKLPRELEEANLDVKDWIALHEVAINTAFRARFAVRLSRSPVNLPHWISPREKSRVLFGPETRPQDVTGKNPVRWPSAKRSGRSVMVRLIARLLGETPATDSGKSKIDDLLMKIWTNLAASKVIINPGDTNWVLDMEQAELVQVRQAGICPFSRRIVTTMPGGVSPTALDHPTVTHFANMPVLPTRKPHGLSAPERRKVQEWSATDPEVQTLKAEGQWAGLHDRLAQFTPVLRAQEHSAQIDRPSLKSYEEEFRAGQLNLLNCSTTMEMGVDLAEIEAVINTNVPPSPANYRQRIGRAGRRGEPWAMAFTFCRDLPLDRRVWNAPSEFLEAQIFAPMVRLDSRVILMRHVNAFLLGRFLADNGGLRLGTGVGDFFGTAADAKPDAAFSDNSVADRFADALRGDWARSDRVSAGLQSLLTGTPLTDEIENLPEASCAQFLQMRETWSREYQTLIGSQQVAESGGSSAEARFFSAQAHRMRKEFLLAELARRGFTPSYGFPIDVVGFSYIGGRISDETKEEGTHFASGPSRSLAAALREYAPGAEVVVDGLVYRSDGILPSWAAQSDPSKVEDLRDLWICQSCGEHGLDTAWREVCPKCDSPLDLTRHRRVLKPSGFISKDSVPHTGYEQLNWVAPQRPRLSAGTAEWQSLSDPSLGRIRSSRNGRIFLSSSGPSSEGFAVCLACGRAGAEVEGPSGIGDENTHLPVGMKDHKPLVRTDRARRDDGKCVGLDPDSRAIQRHVHLGYETQTDIFELQLFPLEQVDDAVAWAIGSALREALSLKLGIQAHDEIGIAVQKTVFADSVNGPSILLFDRAPGGAGFSTLMGTPGLINELLKKAARTLECNKCTDGCPECILRPDLQHDGTPLDRVGALDVLLTSVMDRLIIPESIRVFGEKTELVSNGAYKWLLATARTAPPDEITFFLHGPRHSLDLTEWRAVRALRHFPESCRISIAVPDLLLAAMEQSHKRDLLRVLSRLDAKLVRVASAPTTGGLPHLLEATYQGTTTALATTAPGSELIGEMWGKADVGPVISGEIADPCETQVISVDKLLDFGEANAIVKTMHEGLDGTVQSFGKKFWTRIKSLRPQAFSGGVEVTELLYSDRYVKSPLTAALALSVLTSAPRSSNKLALKIVTTSISYGTPEGWNIWDNWSDTHTRAHVISEIAPGCTVLNVSHKECPHERRLIIGFSDGSRIDIRLDQGFGAWSAKGPRKAFPFDQAPRVQAHLMMKSGVEVELRHAKIGTPFSLTWKGASGNDFKNN